MIWTFRYIRAIREPSGEQDGWWVVYRSVQMKRKEIKTPGEAGYKVEYGELLSAEDSAGRVVKQGRQWIMFFTTSEEPLLDDDTRMVASYPTREEAAIALVAIALRYYNVSFDPEAIYHERKRG